MDDDQWLADRFEEHRAHLRSVAYRMLGSLTEADDAVQDAWERARGAGGDEVENLGGWLTTIVARVCLNGLRARNGRRSELLEAHVPDPVVSAVGELQPEERARIDEHVHWCPECRRMLESLRRTVAGLMGLRVAAPETVVPDVIDRLRREG